MLNCRRTNCRKRAIMSLTCRTFWCFNGRNWMTYAKDFRGQKHTEENRTIVRSHYAIKLIQSELSKGPLLDFSVHMADVKFLSWFKNRKSDSYPVSYTDFPLIFCGTRGWKICLNVLAHLKERMKPHGLMDYWSIMVWWSDTYCALAVCEWAE